MPVTTVTTMAEAHELEESLTTDTNLGHSHRKGWSDLSYLERFKFIVISLAGIPVKLPRPSEPVDTVDGFRGRSTNSFDFNPKEYSSHITFCPPPIFILLISVLQIILFCIPASGNVSRNNLLVYNPCQRYEAWRYVTYILVHKSVGHLLVNVFVQIMIGSLLEFVHKLWRIPVVYFSGALAGCLLQSMVGGKNYIVGASGAVFALLGARIANIILNWKEMGTIRDDMTSLQWQKTLKKIISSTPLQISYCIVLVTVLIASDIYSAVTSEPNVSYAYGAHYGGLIAGLFLGLLTLKNLMQDKWETVVQVIAAILFAVFFIIALSYNIYSPTFLSSDSTKCLNIY